MKKLTLLLGLVVMSLTVLIGQESRFFIPREIKAAYDNGTRSYDGRPGPNYWQNTVDYSIEVEVFPETQSLAGSEMVTYYNNSPDDLSIVVIHLYQDAFRKANPRASRVAEEDITEGVEIKKIKIGDQEVDPSNPQAVNRSGTNMTIRLVQPIPSGEKVKMEFEWAARIPSTTIRGGAYDSTSYFVSYWYPQVAVYDDVFGWDRLSYDFSTEFYNNLGNYDVKITAPKNFTVLSTGVLQNAQEVLPSTVLQNYQKAKTSTETVTVYGPDDLEANLEYLSGTWNYTAEEVSDFAFCLSDHYCWDAANQQVEDRNVLVNSFYPVTIREQAADLTANQQKTMKHFSENVPGIAYPYPEFTTYVESPGRGGGGMEYPMMANNGGPDLGVTVHEMFNTYFPMYVRVNEKRFAWMDEGWADFTTSFVIRRFFEEDEDAPLFGGFSGQVQSNLGTLSDLPLITSTQFMDNSNYGYASYPLPAFLYSVLYDHLGEATFMNCWRTYIRNWAKKSPTPYDFIYTFETVSGQDLSWFWKPWFFNYGDVDVAIDSYKNGKLVVKNMGTRPAPLTVRTKYKDGSTKELKYKASIWNDTKTFKVKLADAKNIEGVAVNYNVPDIELLNNFYPALKDQYGDMKIEEGIYGSYTVVEFPVTVEISKKDEVLFLDLPGTGISSYLMPSGENAFESLDGSFKVNFEKDGDNYTGLKMQLVDFGFTITAKK